MVHLRTNKHNITINSSQHIDMSASTFNEDGVDYVSIQIEQNHLEVMPPIEISWNHPIVDLHYCWHPLSYHNKGLNMDSNDGTISNISSSAPVTCFYNSNGHNRMTCAYSDAVNTLRMNMAVHEEDATLTCKVILFSEPTQISEAYHGMLRIDTRNIPYYDSLSHVSKWWETIGYTPLSVPKYAKYPMYSTWYSFHQDLVPEKIEAQCQIAKQLGCKAVIVDDGWQTSDNNRGYAYCGDWEVSMERIPDMKAHVARVHDIGLKYILWYSVPFVGIHSKAWEIFKDKLLSFNEKIGAGVLDPRYKEVREYLTQTYKKALIEWDLDGFKLDFIDRFTLPNDSVDKPDERRDYTSIHDAVNYFLMHVKKELQTIKPDIMIEFRQKYIGPCMRQYGNMFRVEDCPNNFISNRIGTMDIRLLSGNTATHSDMVMWHIDDDVESAALQMINTLFAIPQISIAFNKLQEKHLKMVKFWLKFWNNHKDVLIEGQLQPLYPELMYPVIIASKHDKKIIAVYSDTVIHFGINVQSQLILVNGTLKETIVLSCDEDLTKRRLITMNCSGELVGDRLITLKKGIHQLKIPKSGIIQLVKKE